MEWPLISIIILNFNGRRFLHDCLSSLEALDYPADRYELIVVDNASADDSVAYLQQHFLGVRIVRNETNLGFAAGNNRGVQAAKGEFVAFLNNDTRVDPQFLRELVLPCLTEKDIVCTGAKMLDWDGQRVDFVRGAMNFHGFGYQPDIGMNDVFKEPGPLLFACGGAMLIRRDVFLESGGFDEDYFIYYEDVDLGWRLWVMGYRIIFVPSAVVYHRLHATMNAFADFRKSVLYERNALVSLLKNYGDDSLTKALPSALMLLIKRAAQALHVAGWDTRPYYIRNADTTDPMENVSRFGLASVVAAEEVIDSLSHIFEKRAIVQARRRRCDAEIFDLFLQPLRANLPYTPDLNADYSHAQYEVARLLGLTDLFRAAPRRVLVVASDLLPLPGFATTGAGLRAWSLGQGLRARGHEVLFAMPRAAVVGRDVKTTERILDLLWEPGTLDEVIARSSADIVVACGWSTAAHLGQSTVPLIVDQHGPHLLERQFQAHLDTETNSAEKLRGLALADFFTCAGERQQAYFEPWLRRAGFEDAGASSAVVPFSLGGDWPEPAPSSGETTFVYGGVFLPWQDPSLALATLVERMEALGRGRLRIFGGQHPFIPIDTQWFKQLTERLSGSSHVEISPMLPRDDLLAEYRCAHVAIDLMVRNSERELAFTSRTVEYLWCGLPVIYNDYAELSGYIGPANAGWCLPPGDRDAMIRVFDEILLHPEVLEERACNARRLARERLNWAQTIDPIDKFCRMPYKRVRASDTRAVEHLPISQAAAIPVLADQRKDLRMLLSEARRHFQRGGWRTLTVETLGFLQRQLDAH